MHTGLERVLMCYVCYRPDVGYVQVGIHYRVLCCVVELPMYCLFNVVDYICRGKTFRWVNSFLFCIDPGHVLIPTSTSSYTYTSISTSPYYFLGYVVPGGDIIIIHG